MDRKKKNKLQKRKPTGCDIIVETGNFFWLEKAAKGVVLCIYKKCLSWNNWLVKLLKGCKNDKKKKHFTLSFARKEIYCITFLSLVICIYKYIKKYKTIT